MKRYSLRKNCKFQYEDETIKVKARAAFKTSEVHWLGAQYSSIVLISIHSAFNEKIDGHIKMHALISTIKNNVSGEITILLSDSAHLKATSLLFQNVDLALKKLSTDARNLHLRYIKYFEGCQVVYWHQYISNNPHYSACQELVKNLYSTDLYFRDLIHLDANTTCSRFNTIADKDLYIQMTIEDIIEQCVGLLVLAKEKYRFQFYPGKPYHSVNYMNTEILNKENRVHWINVFISIENKVYLQAS